MTSTYKLQRLIERFCSGDDISIEASNAIEAALEEAFPSEEWAQDAVLTLASYRPGGGEFLYDEEATKRQLTSVLGHIANRR